MPKGRLVLNDTEAILSALIEGQGICQLGAFLARRRLKKGVCFLL